MANKHPWWPFYGDEFLLDTQHLGPLETGIYVLLLNEYYRTGFPLSDAGYLRRIAKLENYYDPNDPYNQQCETAFQLVLDQFFTHDEEGHVYHNKRADIEIEERNRRYSQRCEAAAEALKVRQRNNGGSNGTPHGSSGDKPNGRPLGNHTVDRAVDTTTINNKAYTTPPTPPFRGGSKRTEKLILNTMRQITASMTGRELDPVAILTEACARCGVPFDDAKYLLGDEA